jgi:hypothetical protein
VADFTLVTVTSGEVVRNSERQIVLNVFNNIKSKTPQKNVAWIANKTAQPTGTCRTSVSKTPDKDAPGPLA